MKILGKKIDENFGVKNWSEKYPEKIDENFGQKN